MGAEFAPVMAVPPGGKPVNHWMLNGAVPFGVATDSCVVPPVMMLCGFALAVALLGGVHGGTVMVTVLLRIGPVLQALVTWTRKVVVALSGGVTRLALVVGLPTGELP